MDAFPQLYDFASISVQMDAQMSSTLLTAEWDVDWIFFRRAGYSTSQYCNPITQTIAVHYLAFCDVSLSCFMTDGENMSMNKKFAD